MPVSLTGRRCGQDGTLYTGSTSNLESRVWKHKARAFPGFTDENDCHHLVWFERHAWVVEAIRRERRIKKWMRDWKLALIERDNPRLARPCGRLVPRQRSGLGAAAGC